MSVFGGDSWGREAQYRKRRVDDLIIEGIDGCGYKKLPNGKLVCLLCPHHPVLDTPLMLSMHVKGSRHRAAESEQKERELSRQYQINKRIALADSSSTAVSSTSSEVRCGSTKTPLIEQVHKAASEILAGESPQCSTMDKSPDVRSDICYYKKENQSIAKSNATEVVAAPEVAFQQQLDYKNRRERELKLISAGWKRDAHGRWFKDENVFACRLSLILMRKIQMFILDSEWGKIMIELMISDPPVALIMA
ncbi:sodium channel modifier 1-like isoform X2 [Coffea eugenioides]|uniref:Sodium channel modifier 1 n=1 Tax=Coffea arabica TaxID=13443 RepID=A0A6P6WCS5_COFAR|nr:sodium channel modifier 1-like isoform X2 [Coffea arabica]XP_027162320.1 sodium channel modifier 1-like isoform X2 [Coffea eugenioides]